MSTMIVAESTPEFQRTGAEYWTISDERAEFYENWRTKLLIADFVELRVEHRYLNPDGEVETLFTSAPISGDDCNSVVLELQNRYDLGLDDTSPSYRHNQVKRIRRYAVRLNSSREYVAVRIRLANR